MKKNKNIYIYEEKNGAIENSQGLLIFLKKKVKILFFFLNLGCIFIFWRHIFPGTALFDVMAVLAMLKLLKPQ